MINPEISFYPRASEVKSQRVFNLDNYLNEIKTGIYYQDIIKLRAMPEGLEQDTFKKNLPGVTISGTFAKRETAALKEHSGFIAIDIDKRDPKEIKELLKNDPYVFAMFESCRGKGVCVIVKINGAKHYPTFHALCEYFFSAYRIVVDSSGADPSRLRFVSFDPDIYINDQSAKFTKVKEYKEPKKVSQIVYVKDDFEQLIKDIVDRNINLCDNYHEWVRIGFAFAEKFGEQGLDYFQLVSANSDKYDPKSCERQYNACMKAGGSKMATMGTFYHYCKEAGLQIYSEKTKKIINSAVSQKKAGVKSKADIVESLKISGIQDSGDIVAQVLDRDIEETVDSNLIDDIVMLLQSKFRMRRNVITRFIDDDGVVCDQRDMNSIYLDVKREYKEATYELFDRIVCSRNTQEYNPFQDFISENIERGRSGKAIIRLFDLIETDDPEYLRYFGTKWLVGLISSIYGEHSPLFLALLSKTTGTGKTQWFRNLLPKDLRKYYAESKLDQEKDDRILMTQKLIVMDDEMSGKSKKDSAKIKNLTSTQVFSLREPYGKNNVDLNRIASLCGTSNDEEIIIDEDDNRRIIPIRVKSIKWRLVSDLSTEVFMEAYHLYHDPNYDWRLTMEDKEYLQRGKSDFERHTPEYELVMKHFKEPDGIQDQGEFLTSTDVQSYLERVTGMKLNTNNIGKALSKAKHTKTSKKINGCSIKVYVLAKINFKPDYEPEETEQDRF